MPLEYVKGSIYYTENFLMQMFVCVLNPFSRIKSPICNLSKYKNKILNKKVFQGIDNIYTA